MCQRQGRAFCAICRTLPLLRFQIPPGVVGGVGVLEGYSGLGVPVHLGFVVDVPPANAVFLGAPPEVLAVGVGGFKGLLLLGAQPVAGAAYGYQMGQIQFLQGDRSSALV